MCAKAQPFLEAFDFCWARLCLGLGGGASELTIVMGLSERRSLSAHQAAKPRYGSNGIGIVYKHAVPAGRRTSKSFGEPFQESNFSNHWRAWFHRRVDRKAFAGARGDGCDL